MGHGDVLQLLLWRLMNANGASLVTNSILASTHLPPVDSRSDERPSTSFETPSVITIEGRPAEINSVERRKNFNRYFWFGWNWTNWETKFRPNSTFPANLITTDLDPAWNWARSMATDIAEALWSICHPNPLGSLSVICSRPPSNIVSFPLTRS